MPEISEKTVGLWVLQTLPKQDWLCILTELVPDQKYEINYRFRYYEDDEIFHSKDRKNFYRGTVTGSRNFALMGVRQCAKELAASAVGQLYEVLNEGNLNNFLEAIGNAPGMHMRMMTPEQYEKEYGGGAK